MINIKIDPVAKPRQTQSDKWKKRPCVLKYRAFADELRLRFKTLNIELGDHLECTFNIPMPKSWSKKKKRSMLNKPHQQKPDADNLCKAVMDSLCEDDSHIYSIHVVKFWDETGSITFWNL